MNAFNTFVVATMGHLFGVELKVVTDCCGAATRLPSSFDLSQQDTQVTQTHAQLQTQRTTDETTGSGSQVFISLLYQMSRWTTGLRTSHLRTTLKIDMHYTQYNFPPLRLGYVPYDAQLVSCGSVARLRSYVSWVDGETDLCDRTRTHAHQDVTNRWGAQ